MTPETLTKNIEWVTAMCRKPPYKVLEPTIQSYVAFCSDLGKELPSEPTLIKYAIIGILITQIRMIDETKLDTIPTEVFKQVAHAMVEGAEATNESYLAFNTEYAKL
jgi:hypothetical protein